MNSFITVAGRIPPIWSLSALLFTACLFATDDNRRAGGEDFPNTLEPLGKAAAGLVAAQSDWNEFDNIPAALDELSDFDSSVNESEAPLAKMSLASADSAWVDASDTALGIIREISLRTGPGAVRREDTLVYRYDQAYRDPEQPFKLLLSRRGSSIRAGRIKTWRFANVDEMGGVDEGRITLILSLGQIFKSHVLEIIPDSAADPDSIQTLGWSSYRFARGRGDDTLETQALHDADGDGLLWAGDSGKVVFNQSIREPVLRPALKSASIRLRGVLARNGWRMRPAFFQETRIEKDGKRVTFQVRGKGADSLFAPGDTVLIDRRVDFDSSAELAHRGDAYVVVVASALPQWQSNRLLSYEATWIWRTGLIRACRFHFAPDEPAAPQELFSRGDFGFAVEYADNATGDAEGRFEGANLDVDYRESRSQTVRDFHVIWDKSGRVLEAR